MIENVLPQSAWFCVMKQIVPLVAAYLAFSSAALAQDAKKDVRAIVQEVDATTGTITVILSEGGKTLADRVRTFNLLKPDIPVTDSLGKAKKLTDLEEDDRVFLKIANDEVLAIHMAPPTLYGNLTKVNLPERKLVIASKFGEKIVSIPAAAKFYYQSQDIPIEDLKTGVPILLAFAPDQKTVVEVRTGKSVNPVAKLTKSTGYLIDVDRDRPSVQVFNNFLTGDQGHLKDILIGKDASFGLLFKGKFFRDLPVEGLARGVRAHVWVEMTTRKVAHLEIEMPILGRRVVKAIDREQRKMTLEDPDGDLSFQLAGNLQIRKGTGSGNLEEIKPETAVSCALSPDRKKVEIITILGK